MPPRPATISIRCPAKMVPGSSSPTGEMYIDRWWSWTAMHPVVTDGVRRCDGSAVQKAGDRGIEPRSTVLETVVVAIRPVPLGGPDGHCREFRPTSERTYVRALVTGRR